MRSGHVGAFHEGKWDYSGAWTVALFAVGAVGVLIFLVAWLLLYWPGRRRPTPIPASGEAHVVDEAADVDAVSTLLLAGATLRHLMRVNEAVDVGDGYYRHTITTEWALPRERDAPPESASPVGAAVTYLVPLMRIARPRVVDNMAVETAAGERISACNTDEFASIVRRIVQYWTKSLTGGDLTGELAEAIETLVRDAQFEARAAATDETGDAAAELIKCLEKLTLPKSWEEPADFWDELHRMLRAFCRAIGDAYIIFVPVEAVPGQRIVLRHTFTRHHRPTRPVRRDRVRLYLGLRPHIHRLTTRENVYAQSYHLQFRATSDQYVFDCTVEPHPASSAPRNLVVAPRGGAGARDFAHVYARPQESPVRHPRAGMRVDLDCREKPPGLLGIVALVAVGQALLIWVVGRFYGAFFPTAGSNSAQSGEVPALLLAVPGLAAAWLGSQFTGERLRSTSLATVVGVLLCSAIAMFSTAAAVSRSAGTLIGSHLGIDHPIWVLFMFASWILAIDLTVRSIARSWRFARRFLHPDESPAFLA